MKSIWASRLNSPDPQPGSWIPPSLTTFFKLFLFNNMITKIDTCKIKHQLNIKIFF
jgi:hypothetical protein